MTTTTTAQAFAARVELARVTHHVDVRRILRRMQWRRVRGRAVLSGREPPTGDELVRLACVLKVDLGWLGGPCPCGACWPWGWYQNQVPGLFTAMCPPKTPRRSHPPKIMAE